MQLVIGLRGEGGEREKKEEWRRIITDFKGPRHEKGENHHALCCLYHFQFLKKNNNNKFDAFIPRATC